MRTNIALFGLGRIGQIHLENLIINPSYNVVYLCDAIKSHAESIKAKYGLNCTVLGQDEFDVAFNDPELTALIIGTPTDTHEALCIRALEANKHVLCEKPLAMTIQSSIRVINLAKSKNLTLLVAFNRRFDPQMRHVADQVQEGKIGEVHTIKTVARDSPRPPTSYLKISGGIFHDCAVHDLDVVRYYTGTEPETVYVIAHSFDKDIAEMNDADTVFITLKLPGGILGHIELGRHARYGYDQRVEVFGSLGQAVSNNQRISAYEVWDASGAQTDCIKPSFKQRYHDAYVAELHHFHDLINKPNETKPLVKPSDCLRVSILAEACEHSWRTGQPVNIAEFTKTILKKEGIENSVFESAME